MAERETIRQEEIELREVLDLVPELIGVFGPERTRLYANRTALEYVGLTLEQWQAISDPLWFFHPDDRERMAREVYADTASEVPHEFEARMRRHDGEYRWFLFRDNPLRDDQGRIKRWYLSGTDIEDRKRAEEQLRAGEARFRTLVDNMADAVLLRDEKKIVDVNQQACDNLGYTREELIGKNPGDFVAPAFDRSQFRWIGDQQNAGAIFSFESIHQRKDGTTFPVEVRVRPFQQNGQQFSLASIRDISDRKRAEEELQASESRFRTLVDHATDAFFLRRDDGRLLDVNKQACESLGYTREELLGMVVEDFDPNLDEALLKWIYERLDAGEVFSFESVHRRKDGTIFPVEVRVRPFWQDGQRLSLSLVRDITERKKAEESRRQSEKQLRDVIETMPAMAWTSRPDGSREFINRHWLEYTGIPLEQALDAGWQVAVHPNDLAILLNQRQALMPSGKTYEGELRLRGKNGEYRWFLARAIPLRDERGDIVRWYGTATDIDDRKRAEERLQRENVVLREEIDRTSMFEDIVGTSPALQKVLAAVSKVAGADSTVLLTGETGTGKELVARAIHKKSLRSGRAFVTVNCAAIPQSLIASELFGHEKGAFTGALQRRLGKFELAEAGTIFLDEVGELPMETQIALLRVLQEREFQRVGGTQTIRLNVRVLAATNRNLQDATATGTFRQDLYYRLNVFPIHIPPLRERKQDIPLLVSYFIDRFARNAGKAIRGIDKGSLELCTAYSWPGNIRELQNVVERAVIICETDTLTIDPSWLSPGDSRSAGVSAALGRKSPAEEKDLIEKVLKDTEGRVSGPSGAAARLGIPASTLEYKIRLLKINKHKFKQYLRDS